MEDEIWRPIPGTLGYEASTEGRIRSPRGNVLKPQPHRLGYRIVTIGFEDGTSKSVTIHSLVAHAFYGPRPTGLDGRPLDVAHGDHDKANNRPANLRYATRSENMQDSIKSGRVKRNGHPWRTVEIGSAFDTSKHRTPTKDLRARCTEWGRELGKVFEVEIAADGRRLVRRSA